MDSIAEITTQQQTAINSIQATLAIQQNDIDNIKTTIADMRISINHMICSVSEIATKLGFQITLPPPLPLSPTPPTSPPAIVAGSPTNVSSLVISTPSPFPPSLAVTHSLQSFHQTPLGHSVPTNITTFFSKTKVVATNVANEALSGNNMDISFSILTNSSNVVAVQFFSLSLVSKFQPTPYVCPFACFSNLHSNSFVAMIGNGQKIRIKDIFIFDPGGRCDAKRDSNLADMVHSYTSQSVAGNYDNETEAIFALHVLMCIGTGHYSSRLYIAYASLVVLGPLLATLVSVVGFNAVMTSGYFASFFVLIIVHVVALVSYVRGILSSKMFKIAMTIVPTLGTSACFTVLAILDALVASSPNKEWSGHILSLFDPTYASKHIPIIASFSEHRPPTWPSYSMNLNPLAFFVPAGTVACFLQLSDASSFVIFYIVISVYFSGIMVCLMFVLVPAARFTCKRKICESNVFVFDPGGTFGIKKAYDLEDKVDFKGKALIRTCTSALRLNLQMMHMLS